jgi:hypothetical protein
MKKIYKLFVYCRRNGVTQDSGEHARCEAETDEEAIRELQKEVSELYRYYDEISWTIKEGDRVVK